MNASGRLDWILLVDEFARANGFELMNLHRNNLNDRMGLTALLNLSWRTRKPAGNAAEKAALAQRAVLPAGGMPREGETAAKERGRAGGASLAVGEPAEDPQEA